MLCTRMQVSLSQLLGVVILTATGCGRSSNLPVRAAVTGIVTLDGQPLTTGTVQFIPEATSDGDHPTATGSIGADGRYTLSTDRQAGGGDGAMLGWHHVRIVAVKPRAKETDPPRSLIPTRYNDVKQSRLRFEVKPVDQNQIDLALTVK